MGRKIFVSYKYHDDDVYTINGNYNATARDYVDEIYEKLKDSNHIYKGEKDNEDLSELSDDTIWEKLKDRIYDSTLTIILISPGMRETGKSDRNQWIPWEVSYSLKETKRKNDSGQEVTSKTNAMLTVVLPDKNNSYKYYLEENSCCISSCSTHHTEKLFNIIKNNKFNSKIANKRTCSNTSGKIWQDECSYIKAVKWENFKDNMEQYIDEAYDRLDNIDDYEICKEI